MAKLAATPVHNIARKMDWPEQEQATQKEREAKD